jgi:acyl-CoA hydrolase
MGISYIGLYASNKTFKYAGKIIIKIINNHCQDQKGKVGSREDRRSHIANAALGVRKDKSQAIRFYFDNNLLQSHLGQIKDQVEKIVDASLKSYTYCYHMISQRKNFVAGLNSNDFLEKIKGEFCRIIRR